MGLTLSYSACERYLTSARSYFYHYFLRLRPVELSSALYFGSAFDTALNVLLARPLDRSPAALQRTKDAFDQAWEKTEIDGKEVILSTPGVIKFSKADLDESLMKDYLRIDHEIDPAWLSLKVKGHLMLEAYAEQIIPRIKEVIAVQKEISLHNEVGDAFTGIIDLIAIWEDSRTILFDNKTSSIRYAENAVEESEQLSTYYEAVKDEYKIDAAGYIVIPKKVRKQKLPKIPIEVLIGQISEPLIAQTFEKYEKALYGIKNGIFPCEPHKCCAKPWPCPYAKMCQSNDETGLTYHKERKR